MGKVNAAAGGAGGAGAGGAGGAGKGKAKGGKGRGAKTKKKTNKKKKKDKLKCGESGSYGDLKKKTGDGQFDRDHVPSKASLKLRAEKFGGGEGLCDAQKKAVDNAANAIAIPKWAHAYYSPTYGSRNTPSRIKQDAKNPQAAARRDTAAVKRGMKKRGASKECQKKYDAWAKKVNGMTPAAYDKMLKKAVGK